MVLRTQNDAIIAAKIEYSDDSNHFCERRGPNQSWLRNQSPAGWKSNRCDLLLRRHSATEATVTIAYLVNRAYPKSYDAEATQAGATALGLQLPVFNATSEADLEPTFASMAQAHVDAVVVAGNVLFTGHRSQLVALAERYKLPATKFEPAVRCSGHARQNHKAEYRGRNLLCGLGMLTPLCRL
jgi:hypothetical protein